MVYKSNLKGRFKLIETGFYYLLAWMIILALFNFHKGFLVVFIGYSLIYFVPLIIVYFNYVNNSQISKVKVYKQKITFISNSLTETEELDKLRVSKVCTRHWTLSAFPWEGNFFYYLIESNERTWIITSLLGEIPLLEKRALKVEKFYPLIRKRPNKK